MSTATINLSMKPDEFYPGEFDVYFGDGDAEKDYDILTPREAIKLADEIRRRVADDVRDEAENLNAELDAAKEAARKAAASTRTFQLEDIKQGFQYKAWGGRRTITKILDRWHGLDDAYNACTHWASKESYLDFLNSDRNFKRIAP